MKMKPKSILAFLALVLALLLAAGAVMSQEDVKSVNDPAFTSPTRPAPIFFHDAHNAKAGLDDCSVCHHVYEGGKKAEGASSEGQACSECHMKGKSTRPLIKAYHGMCRGCHEERKAGPVQCGECHSKRGPEALEGRGK